MGEFLGRGGWANVGEAHKTVSIGNLDFRPSIGKNGVWYGDGRVTSIEGVL